MPQELIYETLYSALSVADSILQIWLTVTFAIIVATYLAGSRIGEFMYILLSTLYGLASLVLVTRYVSSAFQIYRYRDLLIENDFEPWPVPRLVGELIGGGTLLLMIGGTIGTLWFVYSTRNQASVRAA